MYQTRELTPAESNQLHRSLQLQLGHNHLVTAALRAITDNGCGIFKATEASADQPSLLALANTANEAAIDYRLAVDEGGIQGSGSYLSAAAAALVAGSELLQAVDALTSAIVEAENNRPSPGTYTLHSGYPTPENQIGPPRPLPARRGCCDTAITEYHAADCQAPGVIRKSEMDEQRLGWRTV